MIQWCNFHEIGSGSADQMNYHFLLILGYVCLQFVYRHEVYSLLCNAIMWTGFQSFNDPSHHRIQGFAIRLAQLRHMIPFLDY